jgi:hypothetical protein
MKMPALPLAFPEASRNHPEPGHVHTTHIHVGPKPQHVAPRQRGQPGEGGGDNDTVTPQHCFESSLNHVGVAGTASAANYP